MQEKVMPENQKRYLSRSLAIGAILLICLALEFYCRFFLGIHVVYTHFFYIPIVLAALWWGVRGGLFVSLILAFQYVASYLPNVETSTSIRASAFIFIGLVVGVVSDKREKAEKNLQKEKDFSHMIVDTMGEGLTVLNSQDELEFANPRFLEMIGYVFEEVKGWKWKDWIFSDDHSICQKEMEARRQGHVSCYECRIQGKDGLILPTIICGSPRLGPGGEYQGSVSVLTDITERKKAEETLREEEELISSILKTMSHAVVGLRERRILFANEGVKAVFGWKPEELIGQTTRVLYRSEEEFKQIGEHFYPLFKWQKTHSEEFPCRRKDGKDIICRVTASRIGKTLKDKGIVVVYEDITERKKAEEKLISSEERLKIMFENAPDACFLIDLESNFVDSNRAAEEMTGYEREELIGSNFNEIGISVLRSNL